MLSYLHSRPIEVKIDSFKTGVQCEGLGAKAPRVEMHDDAARSNYV